MARFLNMTGTVDTTGWSGISQADQQAAFMQPRTTAGATYSITAFNKNSLFAGKVISAAGSDTARRVPPGTTSLGVSVQSTAMVGTPTVTPSVDWSNDGTNWGASDAFTAITTGTASEYKNLTIKGNYYRVSWTKSGSTSVTVTVVATPQPTPGF